MSSSAPVGVFDSGLGGLSVWREIRRQLPTMSTVYLADQAWLPYGPRPAQEVRKRSELATRLLIERGCGAIVVACNTASAAALHELRAAHPGFPFVGMEPAVKPAAERSRSGVVGVMATPGTLQGKMFADAVARFADGVRVINQPCTGLVEHIERRGPRDKQTLTLLRSLLEPFNDAGADTVVLACTHFAFVADAIASILGQGVEIIDPAPAVARQLGRVYAPPSGGTEGSQVFITTSDASVLEQGLQDLLGVDVKAESVRLD